MLWWTKHNHQNAPPRGLTDYGACGPANVSSRDSAYHHRPGSDKGSVTADSAAPFVFCCLLLAICWSVHVAESLSTVRKDSTKHGMTLPAVVLARGVSTKGSCIGLARGGFLVSVHLAVECFWAMGTNAVVGVLGDEQHFAPRIAVYDAVRLKAKMVVAV